MIRYYSGDTLIHKLDPRVKIALSTSLFLLAFLTRDPLRLSFLLTVVLMIWFYARIPFSENFFLKTLIPIALFTFLIQLLFYPGKVILVSVKIPSWIPYFGGMLAATQEGLINGISMVLRLFIVIMVMPIVTMTTRLERLLNSMVKLGLPYELAFTLTTSINLLSILQADIEDVIEAQKIRGFRGFDEGGIIKKIKAYVPIIIPVAMEGFMIARQMEVAIKSRAFGASNRRTSLINVKMDKVDWIVLFFTLTGTIISLVFFLGFVH